MLFPSVAEGLNCRISGLEISHLVDIVTFACGQSASLQARSLLKETLCFSLIRHPGISNCKTQLSSTNVYGMPIWWWLLRCFTYYLIKIFHSSFWTGHTCMWYITATRGTMKSEFLFLLQCPIHSDSLPSSNCCYQRLLYVSLDIPYTDHFT